MCGFIAADEARHERAYRKMMFGILERDPTGAMEALRDTLGRVAMPAATMSDGRSRALFQHFSDVGSRIGVYDLRDYAENVASFVREAELETLGDLSPDAQRNRDEICMMPERYRKQAEMMDRRRSRKVPFRWLYDRKV